MKRKIRPKNYYVQNDWKKLAETAYLDENNGFKSWMVDNHDYYEVTKDGPKWTPKGKKKGLNLAELYQYYLLQDHIKTT